MNSNKKLDSKIKLYEKLGAIQFQKIVFAVEKFKFKLLKKIFPNYLYYYDKHNDVITKKLLVKATSEEEINVIKYKSKMDKMQERREFYQEKNRNYHINKEHPAQILNYLNWNKKVHVNGIKRNAIFSLLLIPAIILGSELAIAFLILELISAGINFECINLQNYNICRIEKIKDKLIILEERKKKKDSEKYKNISKEIHEAIVEKDDIPTIDEIVERADTKEKLEQLKQLIEKAKSERMIEAKSDEKPKEKAIK